MKNQTLLTITLGVALVVVSGCKSPERYTKIGAGGSLAGAGTGAGAGQSGNLATTPIGLGHGATGEGVTGIPVNTPPSTDLPDDASLLGRDQDRTTFANQTVYFEYDQSTVRASEASNVDQVAADFKSRAAGFDLLIEGHCDERGTEEYNRSLGERRALALRELLIKAGVDGKHIFTRSFGKDQPAVVSHDEAAWSKNRRGEFILVLPKKLITTQLNQ